MTYIHTQYFIEKNLATLFQLSTHIIFFQTAVNKSRCPVLYSSLYIYLYTVHTVTQG